MYFLKVLAVSQNSKISLYISLQQNPTIPLAESIKNIQRYIDIGKVVVNLCCLRTLFIDQFIHPVGGEVMG